MTEKKFRDMLPLSDEQREFLGHPRDTEYRCGSCPLWNKDNPRNSVCTSNVFPEKFMCHEKRAEVLRLDAEYRKKHKLLDDGLPEFIDTKVSKKYGK